MSRTPSARPQADPSHVDRIVEACECDVARARALLRVSEEDPRGAGNAKLMRYTRQEISWRSGCSNSILRATCKQCQWGSGKFRLVSPVGVLGQCGRQRARASLAHCGARQRDVPEEMKSETHDATRGYRY